MKAPKEKALEIYNSFRNIAPVLEANFRSKKNAIIALELKIQGMPSINDTPPVKRKQDDFYIQYWNEVINEVNKL